MALSHPIFQSTLSVRRATADRVQLRHLIVISIHALREESDSPSRIDLSPLLAFQSTLSVRRATVLHVGIVIAVHFNPRSP